jgi:N-methylhydantoinase B
LLADANLALRNERVRIPPKGRQGGSDGKAGDQYALTPDGEQRSLPAKGSNMPLSAGETLVLTTSGGGGLGAPRDRDPERVRADLAEGLVSPEAARSDYGVEPKA